MADGRTEYPPQLPRREDRAVDHGRMGGFEAGVPEQLQSITHGWGEWQFIWFKSGPRRKHEPFLCCHGGEVTRSLRTAAPQPRKPHGGGSPPVTESHLPGMGNPMHPKPTQVRTR